MVSSVLGRLFIGWFGIWEKVEDVGSSEREWVVGEGGVGEGDMVWRMSSRARTGPSECAMKSMDRSGLAAQARGRSLGEPGWTSADGRKRANKHGTNNALTRSLHVTRIVGARGVSEAGGGLSFRSGRILGARPCAVRSERAAWSAAGSKDRTPSSPSACCPPTPTPMSGPETALLSSLLPAMPPSSAFQWFLLICPAAVILTYFLTVFPHSPDSLYIHPSLATLDKSNPSWTLYPDNFYDGGAYAKFPLGTVRPLPCPCTLIPPSCPPASSHRSDIGSSVLKTASGYDLSHLLCPLYVHIPSQVVLIHGLSVPSIIWKDVAPQLAAKGYRVLLYGLWRA